MTDSKTVYIASDHAGIFLKKILDDHLQKQGVTVQDMGTHTTASCDYPVFAHALCQEVLATKGRGILVCGTGIGMSMAANRHPGIRAALCTHEFHARATRQHNDANVLCLGERVTAPGMACLLADIFLSTAFEGGRHEKRLQAINI